MNMSDNMNQVPPTIISPHVPQQFVPQQNFYQQQQPYTVPYMMFPPTSAANVLYNDWKHFQEMQTTNMNLKRVLETQEQNYKACWLTVKMLEKNLQSTMIEKRTLEDVVVALREFTLSKKELSVDNEELKAAQSELTIAREEIINLKLANAVLENKVTELSKEMEALNTSKSSTSEYNDGEGVMDEKQEFAFESKIEQRKKEVDATMNSQSFLSKQFNELGKKHLFMIAYSAEQMYNDFTEKHTDFINNLKSQSEKSVTNKEKCAMIKQMLDVVEMQKNLIKEYRDEFKVTIEFLMNRLDNNQAKVSDLNIRPPRPQFEIPFENFDPLLEVISSIGCFDLDSSNGENLP